jgi:hypothetical protein
VELAQSIGVCLRCPWSGRTESHCDLELQVVDGILHAEDQAVGGRDQLRWLVVDIFQQPGMTAKQH